MKSNKRSLVTKMFYWMRSISLVVVFVAGLNVPVLAQRTTGDTTLPGATIEVIQSYKPKVREIPKPEFTPQLPPADTSRPDVSYEVPQQTLHFKYAAKPIRPLALGKDSLQLPYQNYVKLGGGNLSTAVFDAGIALFHGRTYPTAIQVHHLSQSGNIKNQRFSRSGFEASSSLQYKNHDVRLSLDGLYNRYHLYGYNHSLYEYSRSEVQQAYTGLEAGIELGNRDSGFFGLSYRPYVRLSVYNDREFLSERSVLFGVPVTKDFSDELTAGVGIAGALTRLNSTGNTVNNDYFQLNPFVALTKGGLQGRVGFKPTFGRNDNYFLPDIYLRYRLPETQFSVTSGWEGRLSQNAFKQLTTENPYLSPFFHSGVQTATTELYGTVESNIGNHLRLSGRIGWVHFQNLAQFLNDTGDHKSFYMVYDADVKAVSLEGSAKYQVGNAWSAGVNVVYYNYYESTFQRVWHEPGLRVRGDFTYSPIPQLQVTAYAMILDQIYALNENQLPVKLDATVDIGGGAEYSFLPRLSAFLNVHNLLNNKYQRWYRYESFGINVFGGVRFKF